MRLLDEATTIEAKNAEESQFSPSDRDQQHRCVRCGADQAEFWRDVHLSVVCVQRNVLFPE